MKDPSRESGHFIRITPEFFQGHVSLEHGDGFIRPWRLPYDEIELFREAWWIDWHLIQQAGESTGVRLRFQTDLERLELRVQPLSDRARVFDLVWKNVCYGTFELPAGGNTLAIDGLPGSGETLEIWLPHNAACAVEGFLVEEGASLRPVSDDRRKLAVYGSSITHGQGAVSPTRNWPAVAALARDLNLVCLGFSGQCHLHTPVGRVLRDLEADVYLIKCGINIFMQNSLNGITFMPNLAGLISLVREKNPLSSVVLIAPICHPNHEDPAVENAVGMSIPKFRLQIEETVERFRRVRNDNRIHYVDGRSLFGEDDARQCQPDGIHPSPDGLERIGRRVAEDHLQKTLDL